MKKLLSIILLCGIILTSIAGCGKSGRQLYNQDLSKFVELGKYKGLTVDTSSDAYKNYYNSAMQADVENSELYTKLTEGKVQDGDIANIDYEGKKNGVAFEGGTATGYDLEIGSGSFIDGFEDGLIGVEIGKTVDLNLTFPENYGNEELNGAAVVFTVKVNSVKRAQEPKDYYSKLGFKSLEDYEAEITKRAATACLIDMVVENSEIIKYPEKDIETLYNYEKGRLETYYKNNYGMDFESVIAAYGMTEEQFKQDTLKETIYPEAEQQMVLYYIFDEEGFTCSEEDIEKYLDKVVAENEGVDKQTIKSNYDDFYIEMLYVSDTVSDFLYKNNSVK